MSNQGNKRGPAKRERSPADMNAVEAAQKGIEGGDPRDPNREVKRKRVSMQQTSNLDIVGVELEQDKYYYRWFAEHPDRGGRVSRAEAAFYEFVTDAQGQYITRPSGSGTMYLMRLPIEYWEEDQALKREKNERKLRDEAALKDNEYAPSNKSNKGGDSSIVDRKESDNPYA